MNISKIITSVSSSIVGYTEHFFDDDCRPNEAEGMAEECKDQWDNWRGDFDEEERVQNNDSGEYDDDEQFAIN